MGRLGTQDIYIIFNIWYIFIYGSLHICMILKDTACSSDAARMFFAKMFERYDPLSTPGRLFFCYEGDCCVEDSTDCHQAGFLPKKHTHTHTHRGFVTSRITHQHL